MTQFDLANVGDVGLWMQDITHRDWRGLAGLFLDRDGVVIEESPYLGTPDKVQLIEGAAESIRACNQIGVPVAIVTNQSGVGRGYYTWQDFADVQNELYRLLSASGAHVDFVAACAYHEAARPPYNRASHPWRKPNPGMILGIAGQAGLNLPGSVMIGDRWTDIETAANAGLARGILIGDGSGLSDKQLALGLKAEDIRIDTSSSLRDAMALLLEQAWWTQAMPRSR